MRPSKPPPEPALTPAEEQEKWLHEATTAVKQHAFYMKRAIDESNLKDALKHSSVMLSELRTSRLSPQKYYALFMRACDEMRYLEGFFSDLAKGGRRQLTTGKYVGGFTSMAELYELVQHAGNILPRLYLLVTVASVFLQTKEAAAKDVLKDVVEMTRGVQHPLRGLFLRAYLAQMSKDKLPDLGINNEGGGEANQRVATGGAAVDTRAVSYTGADGNFPHSATVGQWQGATSQVDDAVEFLLQNFTEMNKLWVRMQHQVAVRTKDRREKDRNELRDLVGKNLLVLSQLEGVDLRLYQQKVLPCVLEQVVNCKDAIAQAYLMDAIIQVFPDEFHLQSLDKLDAALGQLQPGVAVGTVLTHLMTRLARYVADDQQVLPAMEEAKVFQKLSEAVRKASTLEATATVAELVALYHALVTFVLQVDTDVLPRLDAVLKLCTASLAPRRDAITGKAVHELLALLSTPLERFDLPTVLALESYPGLLELLADDHQKEMATTILRALFKSGRMLTSPPQVEKLLDFIAVLIRDPDGAPEPEVDEDFEEQQHMVGRLVSSAMRGDTPEAHLKMLQLARRHFGTGGVQRLRFTLPPVIFSCLGLARQVVSAAAAGGAGAVVGGGGVSVKKLFQFLHQTVQVLAENGEVPQLALRLYLHCALAADAARLEPITYEFFTQAFVVYEEQLSDSRRQVTALSLLIGTLEQCKCISSENREALVHKCAGYSSRLLKKPDQCRAAYACSHLFWTASQEADSPDGNNVLLCLKRALKIANKAQEVSVSAGDASSSATGLFIEVLNKYLYFYSAGNQAVTPEILHGLMELIRNEMQASEMGVSAGVEAFYRSTLRHIQHQKAQNPRYQLL